MTIRVGLAWAAAAVAAAVPVAGAQTATLSGTIRFAGAPPWHTVAYLEPHDGVRRPTPPETLLVDQYELRFLPPVLVVAPGSTVLFRNSDPIMHNVFSPRGAGPGFNLGTYPQTESRPHVFAEIGTHIILCHIHPEMAAFVIVLESPYYAVADTAGRFLLTGVPPGRYTLRTWHFRRASAEVELDLRAGDRRMLEIDIPPRSGATRP